MRVIFTIVVIAIVVLILLGMWSGWRRRSRNDAAIVDSAPSLNGAVIATFGGRAETAGGLQYVSTTPVGGPLTRVAAPGLRYRGPAEITVRTDGVTVQVAGEDPVHVPAEQVSGSAAAGRRVGKAVESGGLALLRWQATSGGDAQILESGFRFSERDEQERFAAAIAEIAPQDFNQEEGTR